MQHSAKPLFIALGHEYRSDDGVGVAVMDQMKAVHAELFEFIHHSGDPTDLIDLWHNRDVVLVDAAHCIDKELGAITVFDPLAENSLAQCKSTSSHALSLQDALRFGEVLNKMPRTIQIYAIAGEDFDPGTQLSRPVKAAIAPCVDKILNNHLVMEDRDA